MIVLKYFIHEYKRKRKRLISIICIRVSKEYSKSVTETKNDKTIFFFLHD